MSVYCSFNIHGDHRVLPSFPTRRSSDLCAIASAASRMVTAAGERPLIEMGSRRTHERAAVAAARAAYIAGFGDRKSTRLNSSHTVISYAVFCLKKKKQNIHKL